MREPLDCLPHFVAQWLPKLCAEAHCSGHDGSKEGLGESTTGACKGGGESGGLQFAVVYEPAAHVQSAADYAQDRSDERELQLSR